VNDKQEKKALEYTVHFDTSKLQGEA